MVASYRLAIYEDSIAASALTAAAAVVHLELATMPKNHLMRRQFGGGSAVGLMLA